MHTEKSAPFADIASFYDDELTWGERPTNVPVEIKVTAKDTLTTHENITEELMNGRSQEIIQEQRARGNVITARASGAREMVLHAWVKHPGEIVAAATGVAIAGAIYMAPKIISKMHGDKE